MELVVISSELSIVNEANIINGLFQSGLTRFHLRKPGWNELQLIDLLMQINPVFRSGIALHQHHPIAASFDMKLLHYTEKERLNAPAGQLAHLNKQGYTLSTSVHQLSALHEIKSFNYAFFGPVFNSISKPGYENKLPNDFHLTKTGITSQIIALGGIDESNLSKVKEMNFDGAAVLGALWEKPQQALQTFAKLKMLI